MNNFVVTNSTKKTFEYVITTGSGEEHLYRLDYDTKEAIHAQSDCDMDTEEWKSAKKVESVDDYLEEQSENPRDWKIDF